MAERLNLQADLADDDPQMKEIIRKEKERQKKTLELIASENFASKAVLECLSSCFHNRYYRCQEFYAVEVLAQRRALDVFGLSGDEWGVNVKLYSGSPANLAVYMALVGPHGRIMGLDVTDGGHLTHGWMANTKRLSAASIFFESMPYKVDPSTGIIDYEQLAVTARLFKPSIIVAGTSCYPRNLDYGQFRKIADEVGAYLMSDMAHVSGLVASGILPDPFKYSDVVTTTTHKSLRGPRGGMIFFRKGVRSANAAGDKVLYDFEDKINDAVFPGLQGGPHMHQIAGIAVALRQAQTPDFKQYALQVVANAKALGEELVHLGHSLVTGGTDTHLLLLDLKSYQVSGPKVEWLLDQVSISTNNHACPDDYSAQSPTGLRLGTPALTSRGLKEDDFKSVAEFIHKGILLAFDIQAIAQDSLLKDFKLAAQRDSFQAQISALSLEVANFADSFPMPGYEDN